jgi:IclR family transcriptional regulator, KDG regulon repressor
MQERETQVGVLDKVMAILQIFSREETMLTPREIAARTHLSLPTVYRLVQALSAHGFLEQEEQHFRLGVTLLRLGSLVAEANDLRRLALPHMHRVNARTGESVELHVRQNDASVALEVVSGRQLLRHVVSPGTAFPLHRGAIGTVLLARLPPNRREVLIARSAERWGGTPLDLPRLHAEWEEARTQGWSISEHEPDAGVTAIAAPLFNASEGVEAALALVAPAGHCLSQQRQQWRPLVREAAAHISQAQGYQGNELQFGKKDHLCEKE